MVDIQTLGWAMGWGHASSAPDPSSPQLVRARMRLDSELVLGRQMQATHSQRNSNPSTYYIPPNALYCPVLTPQKLHFSFSLDERLYGLSTCSPADSKL